MKQPRVRWVPGLVFWALVGCRSQALIAPDVSIEPESPAPSDDLVATASCSECTYHWFVDGQPLESIAGDTVSAGLTAGGETWTVLVTETDGDREGPPGEAAVLIQTSFQISLSSDEIYTDDILEASVTAEDEEEDTGGYTYAWMVDGEVVLEGLGETRLDGRTYFDKDQEVYVDVTSSDGNTAVSSDSVIVRNTPPSAPEISINSSVGGGGYAVSFDGEDDYVDLGMGDELADSSWTIEAWAYIDEQPDGETAWLVTRHTDVAEGITMLLIYVGSDGRLIVNMQAATTDHYCVVQTDPNTISEGAWFHVAASREYDTEQCSLYLNGESQGTNSSAGGAVGKLEGNGNLVLGQRLNDPDLLHGLLTEVRVWDSVRTDQEIADHWGTVLDGSESGLLGYWPLQEGEGESSEDASGGGSTATLVGAGWESLAGELEIYEDEASSIQCEVDTDSTDADGDDITYTFEWEVDGEAFTAAETTTHAGDTVPESALDAGSNWICWVTPNDGDEDGDSASASFEVGATCTEIDQALSFDGQNDWVEVPNLSHTGPRTIEAWMLWDPSVVASEPMQLFGGNCSAMGMNNEDFFLLVFPGCNGTGSTYFFDQMAYDESSFDGGWTHVAIVTDGDSYATLFIDGEEISSAEYHSDSQSGTYGGGLGAFTNDGVEGRFAEMVLGSFRISDTERYTSEFTPTVNLESDSDTVLLYTLDEGSGDTLVDDSGDGYDGTIDGPTWVDACDGEESTSSDSPSFFAEYRFDEGSGDELTDYSGNGWDGDIHDVDWTSEGLEFDGGGCVDLNGMNISEYSSYAVHILVEGSSSSSSGRYIGWGNFGGRSRLQISAEGGLTFSYRAEDDTMINEDFGSAALDEQWHLASWVYDDGAYALYLDGEEAVSDTTAADPLTINGAFLGSTESCGDSSDQDLLTDASIAWLGVTDSAPSAGEVEEIYDYVSDLVADRGITLD